MVWLSTDNHLSFGVHSTLKLLKVDGPLRRRGGSGSTILGRVKWDITDSTTGHLDVANISARGISKPVLSQAQCSLLVKEGLKDDDFVTRLNEAHESTEHAYDTLSADNST